MNIDTVLTQLNSPCNGAEHWKTSYVLGRPFTPQEHEERLVDIASRLFFSYRYGFEKIPGTSISSDIGWGCMHRSGQMMVANALLLRDLGRGKVFALLACLSAILSRMEPVKTSGCRRAGCLRQGNGVCDVSNCRFLDCKFVFRRF